MNPLEVAVAVIEDHRGRVLLSQRAADSHQGGLWEFPGGKIEAQEGLDRALRREIAEELGLEVQGHRPLISVIHHYVDRTVHLRVQRVTGYRGSARGLEGQPLAWVDPRQLNDYPLPAADRPIVTALQLPDHYLITGDDPADPERFLHRLEARLEDGLRLLQLRAPGLASDAYRELATRVATRCRDRGARLLLNAPPALVEVCGATGVHLSSRRLMALDSRPLPTGQLVAASCHNASELAQAARIGADFAVLSPVLTTRSHPQATPLGWRRFAELVTPAAMPVYALGGMQPSMVAQAWQQGGQGIAAIGGLWE